MLDKKYGSYIGSEVAQSMDEERIMLYSFRILRILLILMRHRFFTVHSNSFCQAQQPGSNSLTGSPTTSILSVLSVKAFMNQFKRRHTMGELLCVSRFPSRNTYLMGP